MPRPTEEDALRKEAAAWFARMKAPDGQQSRFAFEAWRRADPAHDAAYRSIEQTWRDTALLAFTETGRNRSLDSIRVPLHGRPQWQKIAASFLVVGLALGLGLFAWRNLSSPAKPQFANAIGNPRTIQLADGSMVTLDTDSAITAQLGGPRRLIHVLRGRVRFDVAHDAAHPFVVDAGAGEVVARGTVFDVDMTQPSLSVTLYRGAVDVRFDATDGQPGTINRLAPGQRIVQADSATKTAVVAAPTGEDRWVGGMLSFDEAPLSEVVKQANRYSTNHIEVDTVVADLKVTGAFRAGDNEQLVRALADTLHLAVRRLSDGDWKLDPV